jgi:hypothetical protein
MLGECEHIAAAVVGSLKESYLADGTGIGLAPHTALAGTSLGHAHTMSKTRKTTKAISSRKLSLRIRPRYAPHRERADRSGRFTDDHQRARHESCPRQPLRDVEHEIKDTHDEIVLLAQIFQRYFSYQLRHSTLPDRLRSAVLNHAPGVLSETHPCAVREAETDDAKPVATGWLRAFVGAQHSVGTDEFFNSQDFFVQLGHA